MWVFVQHNRSWWVEWWIRQSWSLLSMRVIWEKLKYNKMMFLSHMMLRKSQYSEALKCSCLSSAGTPCSDCSKNHSHFFLLSSLAGWVSNFSTLSLRNWLPTLCELSDVLLLSCRDSPFHSIWRPHLATEKVLLFKWRTLVSFPVGSKDVPWKKKHVIC